MKPTETPGKANPTESDKAVEDIHGKVSKALASPEGVIRKRITAADLSLDPSKAPRESREDIARKLLGSRIVSTLTDTPFERIISEIEVFGDENDDPAAYTGKRGGGQRKAPGTFDVITIMGQKILLVSTESDRTPACVKIQSLLSEPSGAGRVGKSLGLTPETTATVKGSSSENPGASIYIVEGEIPEGYEAVAKPREKVPNAVLKGLLNWKLIKSK